jgi:hypothetical protein
MTWEPKIQEFKNVLGETRYRINYGPSAYTGRPHNYSLKVWATRKAAQKALARDSKRSPWG